MQQPAGSPSGSPSDPKPLQDIHLLLVEDYPMNVLFARKLLEGWGAMVDVAENGQRALDLIDAGRHQLVLMDLQMPVMDGYESARQMRNRGITLPIIALTASTAEEIREQLQHNGLNDVLSKPLQADKLLQMIRRYVVVG